MNSKVKLADAACLMRLSVGLPGKNRQDRALSQQVKAEHSLGQQAGRWVKQKYPTWALEPIEKLVNAARAYHAAVTLPFEEGIGILPAALIMEYGDRMREFKGKFDHLCESHFKARYPEMIEWAKREHNGTFAPEDYPPVETVMESFSFRTEVAPVPGAEHFTETVKSLLGVDTESVDIRVTDAMQEAQKELLRRLVAPVRAMASKLAEQPKVGKDGKQKEDIVFRDSLVGNLRDIAGIASKLNLSGNAQIEAFIREVATLSTADPETLREDKSVRQSTADTAADLLKRLEGYRIG